MNHEQCEAKLLGHAEKLRIPNGDYVMAPESLRIAIEFAWKAGKNYGFLEGSQHVLDTFDATLGKAKA